MATYNWGVDLPFTAAVDLSGYQYYFVHSGSVAGEVAPVTANGASCLGVLQNDPKAGEEAQVRILGVSKVRGDCEGSSSPLSWGVFIKSASQGMAQGYISLTAGSTFTQGIVIDDSSYTSGSGGYITAIVFPPTKNNA